MLSFYCARPNLKTLFSPLFELPLIFSSLSRGGGPAVCKFKMILRVLTAGANVRKTLFVPGIRYYPLCLCLLVPRAESSVVMCSTAINREPNVVLWGRSFAAIRRTEALG